MKLDIFISYSEPDHKNALIVKTYLEQHLLNLLREHGVCSIEIFTFSNKGQFDTNFKSVIHKAISKSILLFPIITKSSLGSKWVFYEMGFAQRNGSLIVPLVADDCWGSFIKANIFEGDAQKFNINFLADNSFAEKIKNTIVEKNLLSVLFAANSNSYGLKRHFPLQDSLLCGITGTCFYPEQYFAEPGEPVNSKSFRKDGLYFDGNYYLKLYAPEIYQASAFSVAFFLKVDRIRDLLKLRLNKTDPRLEEPMFFFVLGAGEKMHNSGFGLYYGRPARKGYESYAAGFRAFTYCVSDDEGECDSSVYQELSDSATDGDCSKWLFVYAGYDNKRIKTSISAVGTSPAINENEREFKGTNIRHPTLFLGGGFHYTKVYCMTSLLDGTEDSCHIGENGKNRITELYDPHKYKMNSAKHFKSGSVVDPRPYPLGLTDDFRFNGYIRDLMLFDRTHSAKEIDSIYRIHKHSFNNE